MLKVCANAGGIGPASHLFLRKTMRDGADHRSLDRAARRLVGLGEQHQAVGAAVQQPGDVDEIRSRNAISRTGPHDHPPQAYALEAW